MRRFPMTKLKRNISFLLCFLICFVSMFSNASPLIYAADELPGPYIASEAFSVAQGTSGWNWQRVAIDSYENSAYEDMGTYTDGYWHNSPDDVWTSGRVGNGEMYLGSGNYDLAMTYTSQIDGVMDLTAMWNSIAVYSNYTSEDGVYAAIYKNGTKAWPTGGNDGRKLIETNAAADFETVTISVKAGDKLHFRINKNENNNGDNLVWNPIVTYTSTTYNPELDPEFEPEVEPEDGALPGPYKASEAFNGAQGTSGWNWQRVAIGSNDNSAYEDMGAFSNGYWWYSQENDWASGRIGRGEMFAGSGDYDLAMTYRLDSAGVVDITTEGNGIWLYNGYNSNDGAYLAIYKNGVKIWPTAASNEKQLIETDHQITDFGKVTVSVKAGDKLHFRLNKNIDNTDDNIVWNPVITYTSNTYNPELDPENQVETYPIYSYYTNFSNLQGDNGWNYLSSPLGGKVVAEQGGFIADFLGGVWASGKDNWTDGVIGKSFIQPGRLADAVIAFKVPVTGNISIAVRGGEIKLEDSRSASDAGDGAAVGIFKNSAGAISQIWPNSGLQQLANGGNVEFSPITMNVKKNEYIYFRANKGEVNNYHDTISFLPIISYNNVDLDDEGVAEMPTESEKYEPNAGVNETSLPTTKDFSQTENKGNFDFSSFVTDPANNVNGIVTIPQGIYNVTNEPDNEGAVFQVSNLNNVVIDATGVKLVFNEDSRAAIVFEDSENVTLKGLFIEYTSHTNSYNEYVSAIKSSKSIQFEDVSIVNGRGTGVSVEGDSDDITMNKLFISPNMLDTSSSCEIGVHFNETSSNVSVTNSVFVGNKHSSIIDNSEDGARIENNKFSALASNAVWLQSSGAIVRYNTIMDSTSSGIIAGEGELLSNILIAKNVISNTGSGIEQGGNAALVLNNNENSVIFGNVFANVMSLQAIAVNDGKNVTIADNTFSGFDGTPLQLNNVAIALVNNNLNIGTVLKTGSTKQVYGNDIPGDASVSVGADMSRLPQIDKQRFVGMEKRTGVNVRGVPVPLQQYIADAYNNGLSSVIIPPGSYTVLEADWSHLTFNRMRDFTVYAYGVFMECEKYTSSAVQMWNSKNITLKGITMDYKLVANTQGTIISKSGTDFVWRADEGYPSDLTDLSLFDSNSWAEVFHEGSDRPFYDIGFSQKDKNVDGTITLKEATNLSAQDHPLVQHSELKVGDKLVFRGKAGHVNYIYESSDITYEDVTVYGGSGFGYMELNGDGGTQLNRIAFTPGPPPVEGAPERLISTCDATHSTNMRIGIQVRNSFFEKMTDDAANVHSTYGEVSSFNIETKQMKYKGKYVDPIFRAGDHVLVYTLDGKLLSDATAVSDTIETPDGKIVAIDKVFDLVEGETIVQNASASGEGFLYDNCVVINNRARGFLIKASNGAIRNSTLDDNGMSAILVKPEISDGWGESGFSSGLIIENNIIRNSGYYTGSELHSPINISSDREPTTDRAYLNHKNIVIRNNVIEDRYTKYAININGVEGLAIEGNDFGSRIEEYGGFDPSLINPYYPNDNSPSIKISGVYEGTISNNKYPSLITTKVELDATAVNIKGNDLETVGGEEGPSDPINNGTKPTSNNIEKATVSISSNIDKAIVSISNAKNGETVKITLGEETDIPVSVFKAIKSKNLNVIFDMGDFKWTIHGSSIGEIPDNQITLDLKVVKINEGVISTRAENKDIMQLSLSHNGEFPFIATLSFNVGTEYKGKKVILSFYNEDLNRLEYKAAAIVSDDGYIEFNFDHASKYVVSTEIFKGSYVNEVPNIGENHNIQTFVPFFVENGKDKVVSISTMTDKGIYFIAPKTASYSYKDNIVRFEDIDTHWAKSAIEFVTARDLFKGVKAGEFSPNSNMTRGMLVTVMGRLHDIDSTSTSTFGDVATDAYYSPYVAWAADNGIVSGVGNNKFLPDQSITREELAVIIANYAKYAGIDMTSDNANVKAFGENESSVWAKEAVNSVQSAGIMEGTTNNKFEPERSATRAEVSFVIKRVIDKILKDNNKSGK